MSEKKLQGTLWGVNIMLILLFFLPLNELPAILEFVGRLHPLILHFPIALLLVGFLFELLDSRSKTKNHAQSVNILLWTGAFSAVLSAIAGILLSSNGSYSGETFLFHKWFGLVTSLLSTLLLNLRKNSSKTFIPIYSITVIVLIITGHFGASLTHGENFLTEVFKSKETLALKSDITIFDQVIIPILDSKCASCHNPNKLKGGLLLNSRAGILKGGESGPVLVPGDINKSLLTKHIILPKEHDDHMPPNGKIQLSNEEIEMLTWWVENNASFTQKPPEVNQKDPIQIVFANYFKPTESLKIDFASEQIITSLNTEKIRVNQMSDKLPYLAVYMGHHDELTSSDLENLSKVRKQVYSLDLGNSRIDNSIIKALSRFKNLHRLYLDNTTLSDDMLNSVARLKSLEYLNLYGTQVTKDGISKLLSLPNLNQLFVWQTEITEDELAVLQVNNPDIEINGGLSSDSEFTKAQLSSPTLEFESSFFNNKMIVEVAYGLGETELVYRLDDGKPQIVVDGTIEIDKSVKLSLIARKDGWEDSEPTEQTFIKVARNKLRNIALTHPPKGEYKGNGVKTLLDLDKGSENFRDGKWLGFNGDDLILDVELDHPKAVSSVYVSTMEDLGSWIFPTLQIEVWGSSEFEQLVKLSELKFDKPEGPEPKQMKIHQIKFEAKKVSRLQIRAKNYGILPEWHPGKGNPTWLFVDEIAFE